MRQAVLFVGLWQTRFTPMLFLFEGGYCFDALGELTVDVLESFQGA